MDGPLIVSVLGLLIVIATAVCGVVRWVINRIDETRGLSVSHATKLHERVNEVKDKYVKRTDLDRDLRQIEKTQELMRQDIHAINVNMNERLDRVLTLLGQIAAHDAKRNP